MNTQHTITLRGVGLTLLALGAAGCPSLNTYTTPRTIPAGTIQHTVALEAIGAGSSRGSVVLPTLPTYQLRYGISDRLDVGARINNLTSIGADLKINMLRGMLDLSVDPSFQLIYLSVESTSSSGSTSSSSLGLAFLHLPLLVGLNLSRSFTLLATPGFTYALGFAGSTSSTSGDRSQYLASGAMARFGLGFNWRVANAIALQPEVTALWNPATEGFIFNFGIGLQFGSMPEYDRQ